MAANDEPAGPSAGATPSSSRTGDRYFLFNEQGDLIIAKLSPKGYEEIEPGAPHRPDEHDGRQRPQGGLDAPGLREQVRLRPERQGDRLLRPGEVTCWHCYAWYCRLLSCGVAHFPNMRGSPQRFWYGERWMIRRSGSSRPDLYLSSRHAHRRRTTVGRLRDSVRGAGGRCRSQVGRSDRLERRSKGRDQEGREPLRRREGAGRSGEAPGEGLDRAKTEGSPSSRVRRRYARRSKRRHGKARAWRRFVGNSKPSRRHSSAA